MIILKIAIIPDGNRRFSKKFHISLDKAYAHGFEKLLELIEWCKNYDIDEITIWALSSDNLKKRTNVEIQIIFNLSQFYLKKYLEKLIQANIIIQFYGETKNLPTNLTKLFKEAETKTEKNTGLKINLLYNYNGAEDLANLQTKGKLLTEKIPPIDLIIRTSGEQRLSGFLPKQSMYSELIFYPKLWGELNKNDFKKIMIEYSCRERRFGK